MSAIRIDRLVFRYPQGVEALRELSLAVEPGEVFGLLGINGAGKTTLIKVLSTLLRPASGAVRVLGMDSVRQAVEVKRRIGVVPQENNLDTYLDVRHNLLFHCRYHGLRRRESASRVERWLESLGLADKAGEMVLRLSGGTKRKVMLAKAFLTDPDVLILDEPTAGLDPEVRSFVWDRIAQFQRSGKTVFLSTHYLEEAEGLCQRIGILHQGKLVELGKAGGRIGLGERFRTIVGAAA